MFHVSITQKTYVSCFYTPENLAGQKAQVTCNGKTFIFIKSVTRGTNRFSNSITLTSSNCRHFDGFGVDNICNYWRINCKILQVSPLQHKDIWSCSLVSGGSCIFINKMIVIFYAKIKKIVS